MLQAGVAHLNAAAKVQQPEAAKPFQFRQAGVGNVVVEQRQRFQVGQLLEVSQSGVGHVPAAAELERFQLLKMLEDGQPGVGDFGVFQGQFAELRQGRELLHALVGDFGARQGQLAQLGEAGHQFTSASVASQSRRSTATMFLPAS